MSNWSKFGSAILGGIETAFDLGASFIPGGGALKKLKKTAKAALTGSKIVTGVTKDILFNGGADFDGLSADIGDLKNGLAGAKAEIENQSKELKGVINDVKSELEDALKQQGKELDDKIKNLDTRIATATGQLKADLEKEKKERQEEARKLQTAINQVSEELNRVENKLTEAINDLRNEVNERFAQQEQKILNNKRKIEEERLAREAEIRETKDQIKLTSTNLENLRKEKQQLEDDFLNYKSQINQKTADTQQTVEDLEAEYSRKTKIIETKIEDNQEQLEEFNEQLQNVKNEQAQSRLEREEILEELQEQSDLLHFQKHQMNLVSQQMEDISDEIHGEMSKVKKDHHKLFTLANETSQKLGNLTEQVSNISQKTVELEQQIKNNKIELEKTKKEAQLANERLDNYIKAQKLLDTSEQELVFQKIQKSLELKAEESKLLATLKLLQETKKLIKPKPAKRDWKIGVQTGTAPKDFPEPEGYMLKPGSYWEKKYTGDQIKLDNPHKLFTPEWFNWEEENKLAPEDTKFEPWGQRIHADQETAPLTTPQQRKEEQISADQTTDNKNTEEETQAELFLTELENAKTEILTRLQEIQQEVKQNLTKVEKQKSTVPVKPKVKKTPSNFDQELEQKLAESKESIIKDQQKDLAKDWESIQEISEQVLQENSEEEQPELDINQKLAELTQQIKELEANQAASQKQMSKWMLFLIIFLLEYVVYKKQGVLGLAVLNTLLLLVYNYREQLKQYAELWNKYLLIIGYVIGNTLAYSAPEQEKYKWPSVIAFNLIILGIYAYTLYQQKQEQSKLEAVFEEKTAQICQENQITNEEWKAVNNANLLNAYNPFSSKFVAHKEQQLTNLQEIIQEEELINQKALELQHQSELLQKSAEIESNLKEIHNNLGESKMNWTKIKQRYPEFADKSLLLNELALADKLLKKDEAKESNQFFLTKLQRISAISEEESHLLSQLRLTLEQFIAISFWAARFSPAEKEYLSDNYVNLTNEQQLLLLNSGLNSLGIDTYESKEKFVELNYALHQEKQLFGLSTKEKEQILRLLVNTLNLSQEQQEYLENMGISFFNASEWVIDSEQKNHLLSFGLQKINLSENQQDNLLNLSSERLKTFSLTEDQKNILAALAPLTREDKYSPDNLQLLNSLQLKSISLNFLTSEEIIPDSHADFGETKSPYLPLKIKFLLGEQKILREEVKQQEKQLQTEEIKQKKLSILKSLLKIAKSESEWEKESLEKFKTYFQAAIGKEISDAKSDDFCFSLDGWVKLGILETWQSDILLTLGLKTIPKYNYFELLGLACEITETSFMEILEDYNLERDYQKHLEFQKNEPITFNKTIWEKYISSRSSQQRNILKNLNLEELINQKINQALVGYQPPKEEVFYDSSEELEKTEEKEEQTSSFTSRYDSLLDNLNQEDAEREKKKKEREAAKNKFAEAERNRREQKLTEKDRKLKEDEEKRQKEKELAEKEEKKRREAEEARQKALREEQERIFSTKLKNIEEAKKRAEEALENQKKANELAEQKKKDEIEKLEKKNEVEQTRLANQAKLIEEEKQKKLASIALEDQEQRQLIEKRANEEKARIQQEMADKKRKNEEELKRKENELLRQQQTQQIELEKLQKDADLQNRIAEETKRIGREQESILKANRDKESQLRAFRESLWQEVKNYYWASNEARDGTRSPNITSGGYLRDWLNSYPNLQFNLVGGDQFSCNWTNNSWKTAMQAFYRTAGNTFVDQYQFQRLLNEKVRDLGFLN